MNPPPLTPQQRTEQQTEAKRMEEVTLLLANLFDREEATIKSILGCLYDVGTVNFINQRITFVPLRPVAKPIARVSKPILTFMGYRWFKKKCPPLITGWLRRQVTFKPKAKPQPQPMTTPTPTVPLVEAIAVNPQVYQREIKQLRSRVTLTTGALVGVSAVLVLTLMGIDLHTVEQLWQSRTTENQSPARYPTLSTSQYVIER